MKPQYIILLILSALGLAWMFFSSQEQEFDTRAAIEDGISQIVKKVDITDSEKETLKIQLALADYIANNGQPPSSLKELIPKYFFQVPINPETKKEIFYAKEGLSFKLGLQAEVEGKSERNKKLTDLAMVNPNEMDTDSFTYDPTGKRDPFKSFKFSTTGIIDLNKPPLERYAVDQLKVTAILADLTGSGGRTAIVEDATGKGYTVKKGTKVGNKSGVVVAIDEDKIHIVESIVDFTGKAKKYPAVLNLTKPKKDSQVQDNINKNAFR